MVRDSLSDYRAYLWMGLIMAFTDDDLKRLKDHVCGYEKCVICKLIYRLEAAERCITASRGYVINSKDIRAWHKTVGR
jgi:hypothetical protein